MFIIRLAAEALSITETEQGLISLTDSCSETFPASDCLTDTKALHQDKIEKYVSKLANRKRSHGEMNKSANSSNGVDKVQLFTEKLNHGDLERLTTTNNSLPNETDTTRNDNDRINNGINGNGSSTTKSILYDLLSGQENFQNIYKRSRLVLLTLGHPKRSKSFSSCSKARGLVPRTPTSRRRKSSKPAKRDLFPAMNGHSTTPCKADCESVKLSSHTNRAIPGATQTHLDNVSNLGFHPKGVLDQKTLTEPIDRLPINEDMKLNTFHSIVAAARLLKLNEILSNRIPTFQTGKVPEHSDEPLDLSSTKFEVSNLETNHCLPKRRQSCSKTLQSSSSEDSSIPVFRNMTRHNSVTLPIKGQDSYRSLKLTSHLKSFQPQSNTTTSNLPDPSQINKIQDLLKFILTPACMTAALSTAMALCSSSLSNSNTPNNPLNLPTNQFNLNDQNSCQQQQQQSFHSASDHAALFNENSLRNSDTEVPQLSDFESSNPCLTNPANINFPLNLFSKVSTILAQQTMNPNPKSTNGKPISTILTHNTNSNGYGSNFAEQNPHRNRVEMTKHSPHNETKIRRSSAENNAHHQRSKFHYQVEMNPKCPVTMTTYKDIRKHDIQSHSPQDPGHSTCIRIPNNVPTKPGDFLSVKLSKWLERLVNLVKCPKESLKHSIWLSNSAPSLTLRHQLKQLLQSFVLCLTDRSYEDRIELLFASWHHLVLISIVEDCDSTELEQLRTLNSNKSYLVKSDLCQIIHELGRFRRLCDDLKFDRSIFQLIRIGLLILGDRPETAVRTLLRQLEHIIFDCKLVSPSQSPRTHSKLLENPKLKSSLLHQALNKLYEFPKDSIEKLLSPLVKQPIESLIHQLVLIIG